MSSLPPYSTFQTDTRQELMFPQATSNGNVLTFTPPGFRQSLNVKFPDSRLAVCESCKKNFKTRDMCRVRNQHVAPPWTTAYICMTLDETCTDENGRYVDKPMVARMVQWQPFCARDDLNPKTPVCSSCKKTNRTRSFCRERHKHRHLPWCTVYVLLSTEESADPATIVAAPSTPVNDDGKMMGDAGRGQRSEGDVKVRPSTESPLGDEASTAESKNSESFDGVASENVSPGVEGKRGTGNENGDDINDIAESRTMLIMVSTESTSITWLEIAENDDNAASLNLGAEHAQYVVAGIALHSAGVMAAPSIIDPNIGYHQFGYAQHQNALKAQQQQYFYQLQQRQPPYAPPQSPWQYAHPPPHHGYGHPLPPPHTPQQSPASPVSDETPAPTPVTAGEAAAQRQKVLQAAEVNADRHSPTPPPAPPGMVHYQHFHPGATAAQVTPMVGTELQAQSSHAQQHHHQQQPHQQQIPWMMYQQMYQAQHFPVHPQGLYAHPNNPHAPVIASSEPTSPDQRQSESPQDPGIPAHEVSHDYSAEGNEETLQRRQERVGIEDDNDDDNDSDLKRRRLE